MGRNDSGANRKVGETTQGRNDSERKGKWAKRLRGERESGRNDPDSKLQQMYTCSIELEANLLHDKSGFRLAAVNRQIPIRVRYSWKPAP